MQLRAVALALLIVLAPRALDAAVEGSTRVTVFREQGQAGNNVDVVHPQGDVSADLGRTLAISAGYEIDMVSGATPSIYGASTGPDAISGATRFSDLRQAAHGAMAVNTPQVGVTVGYSYSWENDYRSHTISAQARGDFLERNFTFAVGYSRSFDSVCDQNNQGAQSLLDLQALSSSEDCFHPDATDVVTRSLAVHTFEPTLAWTATARLLLQLGGTAQINDGFQSSPYRRVALGNQGRAPQEHVPTLRQRYALFLRAHQAFPGVRAALQAMARAYRDTWDLRAASAELTGFKYLGPSIIVGLTGRYHRQSGASFYRTAQEYRTLGPAGSYWTGDRELAPLATMLGSVKLAYVRRRQQEVQALLEELEIGMKFETLFYDLSADAPNADRRNAFAAQLGLALRF